VHPKYKESGHRIRLVDTGLDLFHYYDVRSPKTSTDFQNEKGKFWVTTPEATNYYERVPRKFVASWRSSHPAPMSKRIESYPFKLDLDSRLWRSTLTKTERKQEWRSKITELFGYGASSGRSSRKIVASHRKHRLNPNIV
jgi:hypothetical protein